MGSEDRYEIRSDARRFENWESYYAGKIGLGVAIDYALDWGLELTWARIRKLAELLRNQLMVWGFITVHDLGSERCGIVTFTVEGRHSTEVQSELARCGLNVSVSIREYTRLDMSARKLEHLVRASVHYYNS